MPYASGGIGSDMEDGQMMTNEELVDLADFFKVFADPTRLRILFLLEEGEHSVSQISGALSMGQSAISQQLKTLRSSRLVRARKDGRSVYYRLCDDHISRILQTGREHNDELYQ